MAVWMDVDLNASAQDVMRTLPRIQPESIVFTHECFPENFIDGKIIEKLVPDSDCVLPPIVAAFRALHREPVGCFLVGNTGAVWDHARGIPPLGVTAILALCDGI
jgi:hypothetical protein